MFQAPIQNLRGHFARFSWGILASICFATLGCTNIASLESRAETEWSSLTQQSAVTTSFEDTDKAIVLPDSFGNAAHFVSLMSLPPGADGAVILKPGYFELTMRSYCLHAGTAGPTRGDGYLYASLKGPSAFIVEHILERSYSEREIAQSDVQTLIWAVLAHTKIEQLAPAMQITAAQLLTPAELIEVNTGGVSVLTSEAMSKMMANAPSSIREVLALENALRAALTDANTTYKDLERIAVTSPLPLNAESVPQGRWSRHPGGYYVRYKPNDYRSVLVQIYVPTGSTVRLKNERDLNEPVFMHANLRVAANNVPSAGSAAMVGDVAVPANTSSQRLAISNVPAEPQVPPPVDCNKHASDYTTLNYGVPGGETTTYTGHQGWDINSQRDEPVFLSLRPSIDMDYVNGQGGTAISGTGNATLQGARVFVEPWKPSATPDGKPGFDYGDVVSVNAQYAYTKADGSSGTFTFYVEYLHLITPSFPPLNNDGTPIPPVPCSGLGPEMKNGKKFSVADLSKRPLIGFDGATQTAHVHVQARLADGSVGGFLKGPLVDPRIVLNGDH
jgi:hypothetical protein